MALTQIRLNKQAKDGSLTADAEGRAKMADSFVDENKIATSVAGDGISGGGGTALALALSELSAAVVDVANDSIALLDATDSGSKIESIVDFIATIAGVGLSDNAGILALDFNELSDVTIDVANDSIAILDATDSSSKRETVSAFITAIAGDGLGDTSGVLAVNFDDSTIETNADALRVKALGITNNELALASVDVDNLSDFRVTEGTGLVIDVAAGFLRNDVTISVKSATTLTLDDDTVNLVELDSSGDPQKTTVNFTSGRVPIAQVTTVAGDVTEVLDRRAWLDIELGASGLTESNFVTREVVAFDFDGADTTGDLANTPATDSEEVYLNGVLQESGGADYSISVATITFNNAPVSGDFVSVSYRK